MNEVMTSFAGLNEGLRVRHIAASPLLTCSVSEDMDEASLKPKFEGIDQIPMTDGERTVAVWDRMSKRKRLLDDSLLVSADAPLWEFIHTVHEQPYRLVVEKTKIAGIVTWSDLLKVPVFVLAFSLLAELELAMNRRILEQYKDDSWVDLLSEEGKQKVRGRQRSRRYANLELPAVEAADLWHKATVLRGVLGAGPDFDVDFEKVLKLRNDVDHVKDMVRSDADLKGFVGHLETAEMWLGKLKKAEPVATGATA
jgi:hypothetical protein